MARRWFSERNSWNWNDNGWDGWNNDWRWNRGGWWRHGWRHHHHHHHWESSDNDW